MDEHAECAFTAPRAPRHGQVVSSSGNLLVLGAETERSILWQRLNAGEAACSSLLLMEGNKGRGEPAERQMLVAFYGDKCWVVLDEKGMASWGFSDVMLLWDLSICLALHGVT